MGRPWEQRKLKDLAESTFGGGTPSTSNSSFWIGNIPWLQSSDIAEDQLFGIIPKKYISAEAINQSAAQLVPENSLAIITRVGVGKLAFIPFSYATSQDFLSLSQLKVDPFFLVYAAHKKLQSELSKVQGTSIKGITKNELLEKIILIPNSCEQKQIGDFFLNFDSLITLHQRQLDLLKEQKKGLLQKMFPRNGSNVPEIRFPNFTDPWEQRKLGELGSISMCRRVFKEQTSEKGDVPFYKIGTFGSKADSYISNELFTEYKENYPYPKKGDILISASGSIGKTVEFTGANEYFQDSNIVWLQHDERLENSFLKCFYSIVKWSGVEGSTIKRLYNNNILNTVIKISSIEEQKTIGQFFSNFDSLITLHQRQLDLLKEQKKGLLQKMFPKSGENEPELRFPEFM